MVSPRQYHLWYSFFFTNLMHKYFILIHLLHSSTCFEHYCAHLQEDNCINTASGIVTLFGWLFSTKVMRGLRCTEQSPKDSDDTRCCVNLLTPNDDYSGHTALLTSKCCILYIYSTNIGTEYFKHDIYSPFFPLLNAVCFINLTYLVPVLFTFYIQGVLKLKKNNSGTKRLTIVLLKMRTTVLETCRGM